MAGFQIFKQFQEKEYIHEKDFKGLVNYICANMQCDTRQIVGTISECTVTVRNSALSKIGVKETICRQLQNVEK